MRALRPRRPRPALRAPARLLPCGPMRPPQLRGCEPRCVCPALLAAHPDLGVLRSLTCNTLSLGILKLMRDAAHVSVAVRDRRHQKPQLRQRMWPRRLHLLAPASDRFDTKGEHCTCHDILAHAVISLS